MNKRKRLLAILINGMLLSSLCVASAADVTAGGGDGGGFWGCGNAPKIENVAIGNGAKIGYSNGASAATGDIVVGNGANINNYASQGGSVAIGKNAKIENMSGGVEASFALGQTTFSGSWFSSARIPSDPTKVVGSVAIGDNTFARTGSTMIGSHNYKGELGDTTVDTATTRKDALNAYATTVGANSFTNGAFATNTGTYNIISSGYNGGRMANPVKNLGSTINGSLNSIESKTANNYYSGIANSIVGTANRTFNSNGSIIMGAGNEITNSVTSIYGAPEDGGNSAKELAGKFREAVKETNGGGGVKNALPADDIKRAVGVIVAADKDVPVERFKGKHVAFVKVAEGIKNPAGLIEGALQQTAPVFNGTGSKSEESTSGEGTESTGRRVYKHLMNGVSHMLPFVIGGGILIALAFLFDMNNAGTATFGSGTPVAAFLKDIGGLAFSMMMPILAGYIAVSIGERPALMPGIIGGFLAANGGSGFFGALFAGFIAGYVVIFLKTVFAKLPQALEGTKPVLLYPVCGLILVGLIMVFVINPPTAVFNQWLLNFGVYTLLLRLFVSLCYGLVV